MNRYCGILPNARDIKPMCADVLGCTNWQCPKWEMAMSALIPWDKCHFPNCLSHSLPNAGYSPDEPRLPAGQTGGGQWTGGGTGGVSGLQKNGQKNNKPPAARASKYGKILSDTAYKSIGMDTKNIAGTDHGREGCAAAVSKMFKAATGENILPGHELVKGTGDLYDGLSRDPRFKKLPLSEAQPGDIVVTARGEKAGHTGIVGLGGEIISNSSHGFDGRTKDPAKAGTVQNNYTVERWRREIMPRNAGETTIFRYIGP